MFSFWNSNTIFSDVAKFITRWHVEKVNCWDFAKKNLTYIAFSKTSKLRSELIHEHVNVPGNYTIQ